MKIHGCQLRFKTMILVVTFMKQGGEIMDYERPIMEVLIIEAKNVDTVNVSNGDGDYTDDPWA